MLYRTCSALFLGLSSICGGLPFVAEPERKYDIPNSMGTSSLKRYTDGTFHISANSTRHFGALGSRYCPSVGMSTSVLTGSPHDVDILLRQLLEFEKDVVVSEI